MFRPQLNDQHGHLDGNRALCRLGQILADCSRSVDSATRHGRDEFAVVLLETGMAAATLVVRRICDLLAKDTEDPALSVSVGIACYPRDGDSIATPLYVADKALYAMNPQGIVMFRGLAPHFHANRFEIRSFAETRNGRYR